MGDSRRLAQWLVDRRKAIDAAVAGRLGGSPAPRSPEAEALRRFRSWTVLQLGTGGAGAPALDGLRVSERRMGRLLDAWVGACGDAAGPDGEAVRAALGPLAERFQLACSGTGTARQKSGSAQPSKRRAVSAAIDRVCDAFLAIDADNGVIEDANPAAGALLGTTRDALLGQELMGFVPPAAREPLWAELDAIAEGGEPRRAELVLLRDGRRLELDGTLTRFATRRRTLALAMLRPRAGLGADPGLRPESPPGARAGTAPDAATRRPPPPGGTSPAASRS